MSKYKLEKWPFEEDVSATLCWINSPQGTEKTVNVFFKSGETITTYQSNWGTLPLLKMGYQYVNGTIANFYDSYDVVDYVEGELRANENINIETKKAYDCIPNSLYSFADMKSGGFEQCCTFENNGDKYIVPCIELVRAIYGDKSYFLNLLLTSDGLEGITIDESITGQHIHLEYANCFPKEFAKDSFVQEYVWLKYTPAVLRGWKSVYSSRIASERKIILKLPFRHIETLLYRGIRSGNYTLILNVELNNLKYPFQNISYTHPSFIEKEKGGSSSKIRFVGTDHPDEIPLGSGGIATQMGGAAFIETEPSKHFRNPPVKIEKIVNRAKENASSSVFIKKEKIEYSMADKTGTGKRMSVDLLPADKVEPIEIDKDFAEFGKAIGYISRIPGISVNVEVGNFKGESGFSRIKHGTHRKYVLANVLFSDGLSLSIIEVDNQDGWAISTLRVWSTGNSRNLAMRMIGRLTQAGGHWDKNWFAGSAGVKYLPLKHFRNRDAKHWAALLIGQE